MWTEIPELAQFRFLNDVRSPLSQAPNRDEIYSQIAEELMNIVIAYNHREYSNPSSKTIKPINLVKEKPNNWQHVFLSYCRDDSDFAELTKLKLEKENTPIWMDNDRLAPGTDWRQDIDESIRQSIAMIVVMSPEARESEYVTYEWAFAWGVNIPVIPLMLRQTPLHPRLATLQFIDFTKKAARPWDKLVHSIKWNRDGV